MQSQPTMHDTIILLILISTAGNGGRYYKKAYSVMNAWLTRGEFPFDLLGTMITLKRSNEVIQMTAYYDSILYIIYV